MIVLPVIISYTKGKEIYVRQAPAIPGPERKRWLMGMFLNNRIPFESYRLVKRDAYFIDKTSLIEELFPLLEVEKRFICIIRPRRFGKSVMANMVGAFFGKAAEAGSLFDTLNIASSKEYRTHLNQHHVIYRL